MNMNLTLLGQTISLFVFVWFCMKFVWPPIIEALAERERRIADGLEAAEKGQRELEQAESQKQELLDHGKVQAQDYVVKAQKRGDEIVEAARDDARKEAERIIAAAHEQTVQEMNRARDDLRDQVAALAMQGAEQILMREVDDAAHKEFLDKISAQL